MTLGDLCQSLAKRSALWQISRIFGPSGEKLIPVMARVTRSLEPFQYKFLSETDYISKLETDLPQGVKQYWHEILSRCHLAAISSLLRHERWIDGTLYAGQSDNFLALCACLRGLLESAADSHFALSKVPFSLVSNKEAILTAIQGKASSITTSSDLEECLIHFSHAAKQRPANLDQDFPNARTNKDYILSFQEGSSLDFYAFYRELCEVTHPAAPSVGFLFQPIENGLTYASEPDRAHINSLCSRYSNVISDLLQRSLNLALIALKTVNRFNVQGLSTAAVDSINADAVPHWRELCTIWNAK